MQRRSEKDRLAEWYARNRKGDPAWREINKRRAFLWRKANRLRPRVSAPMRSKFGAAVPEAASAVEWSAPS